MNGLSLLFINLIFLHPSLQNRSMPSITLSELQLYLLWWTERPIFPDSQVTVLTFWFYHEKSMQFQGCSNAAAFKIKCISNALRGSFKKLIFQNSNQEEICALGT